MRQTPTAPSLSTITLPSCTVADAAVEPLVFSQFGDPEGALDWLDYFAGRVAAMRATAGAAKAGAAATDG